MWTNVTFNILYFNVCVRPYFFFQVFGLNGAVNIVRVLKQRGVQLSFVLDEGLALIDGVFPGLEGPAAL